MSRAIKEGAGVVTGASGDIGRATALRFAEEGAFVILSDINFSGCEKVLAEVEASGGTGAVIPADVTKEDQIVSLFEKIMADYNRLDILVNIAGGDYENDASIDEIGYEKMSFNIV